MIYIYVSRHACCSMLQGVAVCCIVLQGFAVCYSLLQCVEAYFCVFAQTLYQIYDMDLSVVAVCCSVLQCVAVCCSVLHFCPDPLLDI